MLSGSTQTYFFLINPVIFPASVIKIFLSILCHHICTFLKFQFKEHFFKQSLIRKSPLSFFMTVIYLNIYVI